jgi:hypothetical protein
MPQQEFESDEPEDRVYDKRAAQIFHQLQKKFENLGPSERNKQILLHVEQMDIPQELKNRLCLLAARD